MSLGSVNAVRVDQSKPSRLVNEPPATVSVNGAPAPVVIDPAKPEPTAATCSTPATSAIAMSTLPEAARPMSPVAVFVPSTCALMPAKMLAPVNERESTEVVATVCETRLKWPYAAKKPAAKRVTFPAAAVTAVVPDKAAMSAGRVNAVRVDQLKLSRLVNEPPATVRVNGAPAPVVID